MMTSHLVFTGAGVYSPRICPRAILWERTDNDPLFGVFVPTAANAQTFADVVVLEDGRIVQQLLQEDAA